MKKLLIFLFFFLLATAPTRAQKDSIVFKNGDYLIGKIKSLEKNKLKMETNFSDDDFVIKWDEMKEIYTQNEFFIEVTKGRLYEGKLKSVEDGKISIITANADQIEFNANEILLLLELKHGFWSKLDGSIDFGLNLTKANNMKQASIRSSLGYKSEYWQLKLNYHGLGSIQDNTDPIKRRDGGATFIYLLPHNWYPVTAIDFLSNNEQQIKLRSTAKIGMGKFLINNNKSYFSLLAGANFNKEDYTTTNDLDRQNWEAFIGSSLNLYNTGDLDLVTNILVYYGITEKSRLRTDLKFDIKYDLPHDLYVKVGFTINYDNQPAEGSAKSDYVFHTGLGWSF